MTVCVPHGNEACYMCQHDLLADHREREDQTRIAGRAMHDLMVWLFCRSCLSLEDLQAKTAVAAALAMITEMEG